MMSVFGTDVLFTTTWRSSFTGSSERMFTDEKPRCMWDSELNMRYAILSMY